YSGGSWAEFDIFSLLRPPKAFHKNWNSACVQLLRYAYEISRWLSPRRTSALEDLPTEVLVEIFKHMGWKDILASRQVCKRLFEISTARPLWMCLLYRLSAELMAPPILERPIDTYEGGELEHIVLRRISSEVRWTSQLPPRARNVPIRINPGEDCTLLLEGGRWLLLISPPRDCRRVYAYDLDKPSSQEPQCIIDLGEGSGNPQQSWLMEADVDPNESQLTFNLCLIPRYTLEQYPAPSVYVPPADIHIYRLTLNGNRGEAMLMANKIKTLRNEFRAISARSNLRGCYLARHLNVYETASSSIEVCDWVRSDDSTHLKLHIALKSGIPKHIALLPDSKLVVVLGNDILLYDIANLRSVPSGELANESMIQPMIQPYWKHLGSPMYEHTHLSKVYLHQHTTRMAVIVQGIVYGLVIPRQSNDDPWFEPLSDITLSHTHAVSVGINKACVQWRNGTVEIASYLWPGDESKMNDVPSPLVPAARFRTWDFPYEWCARPLFDERTNHIFSFIEGGSHVVVDFAY
ncbi:hypothetical protein BJ912DRAFT_1002810, partial [Pholiota molesta]